MEEKNIILPLKNINDDLDFKKELVDVGGKTQVPCLFIDGVPLYESDDIIQWIEGNVVKS